MTDPQDTQPEGEPNMTEEATPEEMTEATPEAPAPEETPAEEEVDPTQHDYHDVAEGVQGRVMTPDERNVRARLG